MLLQMIPYSHRSTLYMRENGREFLEGNFDPDDVLKLRMPRGSVRKAPLFWSHFRMFET
eukprot:COSAG01_NODE_45146_length_412_cov_0.725240_2_plen_59_part_00